MRSPPRSHSAKTTKVQSSWATVHVALFFQALCCPTLCRGRTRDDREPELRSRAQCAFPGSGDITDRTNMGHRGHFSIVHCSRASGRRGGMSCTSESRPMVLGHRYAARLTYGRLRCSRKHRTAQALGPKVAAYAFSLRPGAYYCPRRNPDEINLPTTPDQAVSHVAFSPPVMPPAPPLNIADAPSRQSPNHPPMPPPLPTGRRKVVLLLVGRQIRALLLSLRNPATFSKSMLGPGHSPDGACWEISLR